MTMPEYVMTKEGKVVPVPTLATPEPEAAELLPEEELEVESETGKPEPRESKPKPEPKEQGDDLSDLFEVPSESVGAEEDLSDLTEVSPGDVTGDGDADMSDDILSSYREEDLSDLVDVTDEDVMGEPAPKPKKRYKATPRRKVTRREPPPSSLGGVR